MLLDSPAANNCSNTHQTPRPRTTASGPRAESCERTCTGAPGGAHVEGGYDRQPCVSQLDNKSETREHTAPSSSRDSWLRRRLQPAQTGGFFFSDLHMVSELPIGRRRPLGGWEKDPAPRGSRSLTHQNTNSLIHSRAFLSGAEMVGFGGKPLAGLGCGFLGPLPWRIAICGAFFTGRGLGFSWSSPLTSPLLVARLNLTSGTGLPLGTWEMGIG